MEELCTRARREGVRLHWAGAQQLRALRPSVPQDLHIFLPTHPPWVNLDGASSRLFLFGGFGLKSETLLRGSAGDTYDVMRGGLLAGDYCLEWLVETKPVIREASGRTWIYSRLRPSPAAHGPDPEPDCLYSKAVLRGKLFDGRIGVPSCTVEKRMEFRPNRIRLDRAPRELTSAQFCQDSSLD